MGRRQCDQIWRNFATLANLKGLFGQNVAPNLINFSCNWANFFAVNGQILKK